MYKSNNIINITVHSTCLSSSVNSSSGHGCRTLISIADLLGLLECLKYEYFKHSSHALGFADISAYYMVRGLRSDTLKGASDT